MKLHFSSSLFLLAAAALLVAPLYPALAQAPATTGHYALILSDAPVIAQVHAPGAAVSEIAVRGRIQSAQANIRAELSSRNFRVVGSVTDVLNAIFVTSPPNRVVELKSIPGVISVVPLMRRHMLLNAATQIMNGPQAWNILGGLSNAGTGIKIGVLDTGIDQTHPMFQDSSLPMPAGFPKCDVQSNCAFTTNKVIVARSYVSIDAAGYTTNPAASSAPDDYSARDRVGHGTAVASSAAGNTATGTVTINGMAPKAYLGNYKIAGSPDVNDGAIDDAMIAALDDAVKDGMDVITISFGGFASAGPLDTGSDCGNAPGAQCDPLAYAFEMAAEGGHTVLAAAGNEGDFGAYGTATNYPTYETVGSPADAPSVIAVGGVSNSHTFNPGIIVSGSSVPGNLNLITAGFTDAYSPFGAYSGALIDLAQDGDSDDLACNALPAFSLNGEIALIERGTCTFATKMTNAVNAGAIGVLFWDDTSEPISQFVPGGLGNFTQQVLAISQSDGQNLKAFIDSNPGYPVTLDPNAIEQSLSGPPVLVSYSSFGPGVGTLAVKPDVLGVAAESMNGDLIYMAAQDFDPLGEVYSSNRFIAAGGTSFATPLTAGIGAMVKQQHPNYSGQQVKSAIVNTAAQTITSDDNGYSVNVLQTGSGLAQADAAINTNVTIVPSTVTFGSIAAGSSTSQTATLAFTNTGSSAVSLALAVAQTAIAPGGATVAVNPSSLSLAAGATQNVSVSLSGKVSSGGLYYGNINVNGGSVGLHVPYQFISPVGTAQGANLDPVIGDQDMAEVGQPIPDGSVGFQLTDANGAPIVGVPVTFAEGRGSVPLTLSEVSSTTDNYGYAYANVTISSQTGGYVVNATGGGQSYQFTGTVVAQPAINVSNGVVGVANAAPAATGSPIAPGSYAAIYGSNFAPSPAEFYTDYLPLSLNTVTVSFDAPGTGSLPPISVPGYLSYASSGQVNVFVPWELQGYSSAQVKVTVNEYDYGTLVTVPIANYAPAFFPGPNGNVAAVDTAVISSSHAATRGQNVSLYVNGLGPVNNQPASGFPAALNNTQTTTQQPVVTIGGQSAPASYSGLAPGYVGLYQINVTVPSNISAGSQPVTLSIGGVSAEAGSLNVQ